MVSLLPVVSGCGSTDGAPAADDAATADVTAGDALDTSPPTDVPADVHTDVHTDAPDAPALCPGDVLAPFEGGAAYYARWSHGPPSAPGFFPISVWLQSPGNAPRFAALGINQYIGLYNGPSEGDLTTLTTGKMPALGDQNAVGLAHLSDPILRGWTQQDEPDNAQPDGAGGYGPCVAPSTIVASYAAWTGKDATRPVFLNFGRGAADTAWFGRGSACASKTDMYPQYAAGADVLSFDIYPVNDAAGKEPPKLWMVAQGVDNIRGWADRKKPVWTWIETTAIDGAAKPTPAQLRMEVWSAVVHGALGIGYFVHQFKPAFSEAALLDDATTSAAVLEVDTQLGKLAPVLDTPSIANGVGVKTTDAAIPIDVMLKRFGGSTYLFAVGMRDGKNQATFTLSCVGKAAKAEVLGESRTVDVTAGVLTDAFEPYAVHLYKIDP